MFCTQKTSGAGACVIAVVLEAVLPSVLDAAVDSDVEDSEPSELHAATPRAAETRTTEVVLIRDRIVPPTFRPSARAPSARLSALPVDAAVANQRT